MKKNILPQKNIDIQMFVSLVFKLQNSLKFSVQCQLCLQTFCVYKIYFLLVSNEIKLENNEHIQSKKVKSKIKQVKHFL